MSRLFDALQAARPDITKRFEASEARGNEPEPPRAPARSGRFNEQFLPLLEKLEQGRDEARAARTIGFAGLRGGEGTTTVVRDFAEFVSSQLQVPVLVLDVRSDEAPEVAAYIDGLLEPAADRAARSFTAATLVVPARLQPLSADLEKLLAPLASRFAWILVDCGSLLSPQRHTPALAVLEKVVLVAEAGRTLSRDLTRAARIARAAGGDVAGMILNKRANRIPRWVRAMLARLHLT